MSLLNVRYVYHLEPKESLMYGTFNRVLLEFLQTVRLIGTGHFDGNRIKNSNYHTFALLF